MESLNLSDVGAVFPCTLVKGPMYCRKMGEADAFFAKALTCWRDQVYQRVRVVEQKNSGRGALHICLDLNALVLGVQCFDVNLRSV